MDNAFTYLGANKLETESNYPYKGVGGKCDYDASKGVVSTTGSFFLDVESNEETIASVLADIGPLAVAINANPL